MIRPGPTIRIPAARVHDGSAIIARRWARWIWPEDEDQQSLPAALRRLAATGGVLYLAGTAVLDSPVLMWPAASAWCVVAYRTRPEPETEEPVDDEAAQDDPEPEPGPDEAEFTELVRALIGDGPGIHLAEIPPALTRRWPHRHWTPADARHLAAEAGLPIAGTRSATRPGSSTGIRAKDLPPLPDRETSPDGVVAAGQPANNNTNNTIVDEIGQGGWVTRDPAETTARHHVA
ncbi:MULTISPECIES: hypothetical protein [Streptomyces]|uniref:hypothetical protein n=1 Tax=Streptomyces TaxID=1883 RepID=UPI00186ADD5A|nr:MULTISPECIES: hypothetical protein [Streptomyces]